MNKIKTLIKKNWRIWFALYICIYLPWFFFLENTITQNSPNLNIIHSPIDNYIPFNEYFIIPYVLWFFYVLAVCVLLFLKGSNREYIKLAVSLIAGMSISLVICMIYPNGLNLRPETFDNNNLFTRIVQGLYVTDTSTNVFPSIHVYNSLAVHIALSKCKAMQNHRIIKLSSLILCVSICLSTVFLKQHSIIDAAGSFILMAVIYALVYYIPEYKRTTSTSKLKRPERVIEN